MCCPCLTLSATLIYRYLEPLDEPAELACSGFLSISIQSIDGYGSP